MQLNQTALVYAAAKGQAVSVRLLLEAGAHREAKDNVRICSCSVHQTLSRPVCPFILKFYMIPVNFVLTSIAVFFSVLLFGLDLLFNF